MIEGIPVPILKEKYHDFFLPIVFMGILHDRQVRYPTLIPGGKCLVTLKLARL